jgi:hypothetical protein
MAYRSPSGNSFNHSSYWLAPCERAKLARCEHAKKDQRDFLGLWIVATLHFT